MLVLHWHKTCMSHARNLHLNTIQIATSGKAAPEWVQLTPAGPILPDNDGRGHRLSNPEAVVAAFNAYAHPLPVDVEHATHVRGDQGLDAPAYGWLQEVEARDGALWGRVEWLEQGAAWIASKAYKFLSIGYQVDKVTKEITDLLSVGLTNKPGFQMPQLAKQGDTKENETMDKSVLEALGLSQSATAADVVLAIASLKTEVHTAKTAAPDIEKYVPKAQLDTANAKIKEFETAETARADSEITAAVEAGVTAGKIAPAAKDGFVAMAKAQGVETFNKTLEAMPVVVASTKDMDEKEAARQKASGKLTDEEKFVAKQLGQTEADFLKAKEQQES